MLYFQEITAKYPLKYWSMLNAQCPVVTDLRKMELSTNIPLIDLDLDFQIIVNLGIEYNEYLLIEIIQVNGIKFLKVRDEDNRLIASSLKIETLAIDTNLDYLYLENNDLTQLLIEREILALVKEFDTGIECQLIILSDFDELAEI